MKKLRKISLMLSYGGFVYLVVLFIGITKFSENGNISSLLSILFYAGIAVFFVVEIAAIVISLIFWRCQYCDKGFPIQVESMDKAKICPFCGHPLK